MQRLLLGVHILAIISFTNKMIVVDSESQSDVYFINQIWYFIIIQNAER